ncbi:hypothetical protein CDEST_05723 [Colletotrichum destructivum]|uniref:Integral membrane protein n=1 Tax=Colletotrichum destructivum TaxID=34406 RepID=A0AAX4ICL4_9PEZI|nr:hypothetical protein CDEST_05723 [Colletotrichum destructivum]
MGFSYDDCRRFPGPLEPYGDIAGLGVVIGFVASAWLTVLILVAYYVFAFDPLADPFEGTGKQNNQNKPPYTPNPMDLLLASYTKYLRRRQNHEGYSIENVFHKCMLSLADAQLITGISILVSGFWSLKHGPGLSAYHWKMVVSLAWFSSVTHLSALTFLRSYLAKHPAGRLWRLGLMLILLVLLSVAFIPTGHFVFINTTVDATFFYNLDQASYPTSVIDLGQALYPIDCDDFQPPDPGLPYSHYLPYYPKPSEYFNRTIDAELLRNGTIGPKNCRIAGTPAFQLIITGAIVHLNETEYLWIRDYPAVQRTTSILLASPAACFFKKSKGQPTVAFVSMVSSLLLLAYSYLIRAAKVFEGPSQIISQRIQSALDRGYSALVKKWNWCLTRRKRGVLVAFGMVFLPFQASIYCTVRVFLHLYTSMFAEVFSVVVSAIWGTLSINELKNLSRSDRVEENDWTFGQVMSLALLLSSLLPIFDLLFKSCFTRKQLSGCPFVPIGGPSATPCEAEIQLEDVGHMDDMGFRPMSLNSNTPTPDVSSSTSKQENMTFLSQQEIQ